MDIVYPPREPLADAPTVGRRNEVTGCPTGLADEPSQVVDAAHVHGPLGVEKLEGRQESGRDNQDEAEEDEPDRP